MIINGNKISFIAYFSISQTQNRNPPARGRPVPSKYPSFVFRCEFTMHNTCSAAFENKQQMHKVMLNHVRMQYCMVGVQQLYSVHGMRKGQEEACNRPTDCVYMFIDGAHTHYTYAILHMYTNSCETDNYKRN